jgi:hypothetical protein
VIVAVGVEVAEVVETAVKRAQLELLLQELLVGPFEFSWAEAEVQVVCSEAVS